MFNGGSAEPGSCAAELTSALTDMQKGRSADDFGWRVRVEDVQEAGNSVQEQAKPPMGGVRRSVSSMQARRYCHPLLIERVLLLQKGPVTECSRNDGYGIIGAYGIVYAGIAVSRTSNVCLYQD